MSNYINLWRIFISPASEGWLKVMFSVCPPPGGLPQSGSQSLPQTLVPGPFWRLPQCLVPCPFWGYPRTGVPPAKTGVHPGQNWGTPQPGLGTPQPGLGCSHRRTFLLPFMWGVFVRADIKFMWDLIQPFEKRSRSRSKIMPGCFTTKGHHTWMLIISNEPCMNGKVQKGHHIWILLPIPECFWCKKVSMPEYWLVMVVQRHAWMLSAKRSDGFCYTVRKKIIKW